MSQVKPVRIFIVGPVAAGKSTMRAFATHWLTTRGREVADLELDAILRSINSPGKEDGTYEYTPCGALVLHEPQRQVATAMDVLCDQIRQHIDAFVAEFPSVDLNSSIKILPPESLHDALIIFVTAPLVERHKRNENRGNLWIPERALRDYPEEPGEIRIPHPRTLIIRRIVNVGSIASFLQEANTALLEYTGDIALSSP